MAKAVPIKADIRNKTGTQDSRRCRREGLLPAVVYGHQKETVSVAVPTAEFVHHLHHGVHLLELQMPADAKETVLIKTVQYDYLDTTPVHVDLTRVDLSERVRVTVPVVLRGTPAGATEGGTLQQVLAALEIECLVTDIPDNLRARVNELKIGDSLKAKDIPLPEGATLVTDPDVMVANVTLITEEEVAPATVAAEGETAEPEVIGKGKEKEEGEEGAEEEPKK
jgi:large subunit ribosomal protein L25